MICKICRYIEIFFLNPDVFFKKAIWLILKRVTPLRKGVVQAQIGGYRLDTIPSRNYWWKSMYYGYCDVEIHYNIKKYLTSGGIFIDAGAGVGYFSAIASELVGISGQVHSFEPFLLNIEGIQRMIKSNPNSNIVLNGYALGVEDSIQNYYLNKNVKGLKASMHKNFIEKVDEIFKVKTQRLDTYLKEKNISKVSLIKIDVEGYEYNVLRGLAGFFEGTTCRPPIICEISFPTFGFSLSELYDYMNDYGYRAFNIFNTRNKIDIRLLSEMTDVVFLPTNTE
ncbi:MAG: FkbM family methyltransferase [Nitrospirae bacterium]|nr:FkbM family methyltransferase [Nitrospirota bacterium]